MTRRIIVLVLTRLQAPITIPEVEANSKFTNSVVREERNVSYESKRMLEALSLVLNVVFKDTEKSEGPTDLLGFGTKS